MIRRAVRFAVLAIVCGSLAAQPAAAQVPRRPAGLDGSRAAIAGDVARRFANPWPAANGR